MSLPPAECIHSRPAPDHDRVACNADTRVQGADWGTALGVCLLLGSVFCLPALPGPWGVVCIVGSLLYIALCVLIATSARERPRD